MFSINRWSGLEECFETKLGPGDNAYLILPDPSMPAIETFPDCKIGTYMPAPDPAQSPFDVPRIVSYNAFMLHDFFGISGANGTRLQDAMERTKDPLKFRSLRACVPEPVDALNHARLLGLLKWPTCLDTCRQDLLVAFNKETWRDAKTSFWDAVAWVRDNHLDVESPAKWVDDSESQAHR